jgi:uncharacterized membrane protein
MRPTSLPPRTEKSSAPRAPARNVTLWQWAVIVVLIICYAVLSQYSNSVPDAKGLAAGLSVGPLLLIGAVLVWRWSHPLPASLIFALVGVLLFRYWPVLTKYYEWSDVVQQCGAYGLASVSFGRSLLGDRVPLCTQLMDKLHGPLAAAEIAYMHKATVAWTLFYALLAAAILALFFVAPLRLWSLFVNFGTFGLMGLMFMADHAIRHRVLPHRQAGILAALRRSLNG